MLRASSLLFALVLIILIFITLLSLILFQFSQFKLNSKYADSRDLVLNCESGINLFLTTYSDSDSLITDLYGKGVDSVKVMREPWGLYDLVLCEAKRRKATFRGVVLCGEPARKQVSTAVYLPDNISPLSLSGSSSITGDCFLPAARIKRGHIEGKAFVGGELVNGTIEESDYDIPPLASYIETRFENSLSFSGPLLDISELKGDTLAVSFFDQKQVFYSPKAVRLSNLSLSGKIVILSAEQITIDGSCRLENIILIAPSVIFNEGFSGSCQVFSNEKIELKHNVSLKYPSVLLLIGISVNMPSIEMENSRFEGLIVDNSIAMSNSFVNIKNSEVTGVIYARNYCGISGKLKGSVYANEFLLRTSSSTYTNHLLDCEINLSLLEDDVLIPPIFDTESKTIVTWLN